MTGLLTIAAVLSLTWGPAVHAAEPGLESVWSTYRQHASFPVPELDATQLERLDSGEVVKLRLPRDGDNPVGAMALVLTEQSKENMWLSSLDDDQPYPDDFMMHMLPTLGSELQRWYGFMDVPAPFDDRHFVVRTTINESLHDKTGGSMWERWWVLDTSGEQAMRGVIEAGGFTRLDLDRFEDAVFLPANRGAWIFLDLPDGRLLFAYHTAAALGGVVPDRLVTGYLYRGLDDIMARTMKRAAEMKSHYVGGHEVLMSGTGKPLPRY